MKTEAKTVGEFWRIERVKRETGLCVSTIYELMAAGEFPKNFALSRQARAWVSTEVENWKMRRLQEARGEAAAA